MIYQYFVCQLTRTLLLSKVRHIRVAKPVFKIGVWKGKKENEKYNRNIMITWIRSAFEIEGGYGRGLEQSYPSSPSIFPIKRLNGIFCTLSNNIL